MRITTFLISALAIFLMSDAADAAPAVCGEISPRIEFCQNGEWLPLDNHDQGISSWHNEDGLIAKLIYEDAPDSDNLTTEMMEEAILSLVSTQVGGADEVQIETLSGGVMSGRLVGTLIYSFLSQERDVLAHHSYVVDDGLVIQFMTFSHSIDKTQAGALHRRFLSGFSVSAPSIKV